MHLKSIDIYGFKSFAHRTQILLQEGITAIVGPNGSGKSNIADAVRWVLGEQSARSLRGTKMEEIIFDGTERRKAMPYCEVALTFDNTDGTLPMDFSEVQVMRRLYRSGVSEYTINRNACRLKDILEMFRDTGIGKEGYSIIGQGNIDSVLSSRAEDRRGVFEEAAGINKYRVRKDEAQRKLDHTQNNMIRIQDIMDEQRIQLEPLEQQCAHAREYLQLQARLRDLELHVFQYKRERSLERAQALQDALAACAVQLDDIGTRAQKNQDDQLQIKTQERQLQDALNALLAEISEKTVRMEKAEGEHKLKLQRLQNAQEENARYAQDLIELEARESEIAQKKAQTEAQLHAARNNHEDLLGSLKQEQHELDALDAELSAWEAALNEKKDTLIQSLNKLSDAKSQSSRLSAMRGAYETRLTEIEQQLSKETQENQSLSEESSDVQDIIQSLQAELDQKKQRVEQEDQGIKKLQQEIDSQSAHQRELDREYSAEQSRIGMLKDMQRDYEGYYMSVRNLLQDAQQNEILRHHMVGVVAQIISVDKVYEKALETALGNALQNIVTQTPEDAKWIIEYLRAQKYGRATFLPIQTLRPKLLSTQERALLGIKGCIGCATELVSCDKAYAKVVDYLLGRTVVVQDMDTAIALSRKSQAAFRIVTVQGDIMHPGGSMSGGSEQGKHTSLLSRERVLQDTQHKLEALTAEREQNKTHILTAQQRVQTLKQDRTQLYQEIQQLEVRLAAEREKSEAVDQIHQKHKETRERLALERSQLMENIQDIDQKLSEIGTLEQGMAESQQTTQSDIAREQADLAKKRAQRDERFEAYSRVRMRQVALEKECAECERELARLKREQDYVQTQRDKALAETEKNTALCIEIEGDLLNHQTLSEQGQAEMQAQQEQLAALQARKAALLPEQDALAQQAQALSQESIEVQDKQHRTQMQLTKLEIETEHEKQRILETYGLTLEQACALPEKTQITAVYQEIESIKERVREMGSVNVNAVEEYNRLSARHAEMEKQKQDLEKAREDLNIIIQDLTGAMQKRFKEQFARIAENFGMVFRELFEGGHAELRLSDTGDVLNAGVEISAQPPGKSLKNINLLSGGEKALTAIALLFAMLKLRPSPFCVLDEIDASLDEVNVDSFIKYVRKFTSQTQFILITHRKGSMAQSDNLYGVAMEEKGITKLVSVRMLSDETEQTGDGAQAAG